MLPLFKYIIMIIEINKKKYTVKAGNRAFQNLLSTVGLKDLTDGRFTFDSIVSLYKDSIKDKGKLTDAELEEWVDECPTASEDIMAEISAFKALAGEAKK
jgi:hypothetical protein|tara:strand:- start:215 stop:514 length:300 start_codon:yes stop_codon:yes gene_type:complete